MKPSAYFHFAAAVLLSTSAHAQGLLALGQNQDYKENIPLTFNLTAGGGYERLHYTSPLLSDSNVDSAFLQGGVGLNYATGSRITKYNVSADFGLIRYLDDPNRGDNLYYNARAAFNITSELSRRMKVSDNFYLAYEIEPDFATGASTGTRSGQYLYGYNNFNIAYAWTERFSTTTGYTITGIHYMDDNQSSSFENRLSHLLSQQFGYKLSRTTTLTAEYRYGVTNYQNQADGLPSPDYRSHYLLVGVDQAWSPTTTGSLRAGAEYYDSERTSKTSPYVEGSLNYAVSRHTALRWYGTVGFDGSELGQYDSRYSYRTGITATNQVTEQLSATAGVHYVHSDFTGNSTVVGFSEDEVNLNIGVNYNFTKNLGVQAGYTYTTIGSDLDLRDYNRHHMNVGLNATF